jgi:arylsulfatase A-like enzyme
MPAELKLILERQMEIYAGFLSHTDHHVGRLLDTIEELGILDETLIYVIIGDNGASAEGTLHGSFNEMINFNGMGALETPEFMGKGGDVSLYYNGNQVGEGRVETTQPFIFSSDEGLDIGCETRTAVAPECDVHSSEFSGEINWVELKVGEDDNGHLVDPEDYIKVLIARQ